ncbi:hypothetical protein HOH87_00950 [bacterium]|jgi:hypothetical protein|nr:hypothetical protein [bacterium]
MNVIKELVINKDIESVWNVMGTQFADVHLWSSNFQDSKPGGTQKFEGLAYSSRVTLTGRGETIQELDSFDATNHRFSYHISKGIPSIVKTAVGIWALEPIGDIQSKLVLEFQMEPNGLLGTLLTPVIKKKFGKVASDIAEELKYYVENGTPHPRKVAANSTTG